MRVAIFIQLLTDNAGQTQDIIGLIDILRCAPYNFKFTIFTNQIIEPFNPPPGIHITRINRYYSFLFWPFGLKKVLSGFDVAYVKGNFPYLIPAKLSNLKTILVVHQIDLAKSTKGYSNKLKVVAANLLFPFFLRVADKVVTISSELSQKYKEEFGVDCEVADDPIDNAFFDSHLIRSSKIEHSKLKLLSVGNFDIGVGRKRQDVLLSKLSKVKTSDLDYSITLAGLNEESIRYLDAIAHTLGISQKVTLLPILSKKDLIHQYQCHDIYITHTTYEGFYRQVVEGFATGLPALVYDSTMEINDFSARASVNHVIKSGAGELFITESDIVEAINKIKSNYGNYSCKGKKYAEMYSYKAVSKSIFEIFQKLTSSKK